MPDWCLNPGDPACDEISLIEEKLDEGIEIGKQDGKREEREILARKLLAKGILPVGEIAELTGLSGAEVERLAEGRPS